MRGTKTGSLLTRLFLLTVMLQGALLVSPVPAAAAGPQTTIRSGPSGLVASRSATFRFTSSLSGSAFQCRLDAGSWSKCTSPKSYTLLGQGSHTFRVRAVKNGAVDPTPAVRTFTVDTVKPNTYFVDAELPTRLLHGSHPFVLGASEPATWQCRLDGAAFEPCGPAPFVPDLLPDRIHTVQLRARDLAGNVDATPATHQISKVSLLSFSQETGEAAAEYFLPDNLTMDVPASCGGSSDVDCPGGIPMPPAEQLSMTSTRSVFRVSGSSRYDVTATTAVQTLLPIKVEVPLGAECDLSVNSADGTIPTWSLTAQMNVLTDSTSGERFLSSANHALNGVEDDDLELTGSFACQLASSGLAFIRDLLTDQLVGIIADRMPPTCMAPGPPLFETCPWVGL